MCLGWSQPWAVTADFTIRPDSLKARSGDLEPQPLCDPWHSRPSGEAEPATTGRRLLVTCGSASALTSCWGMLIGAPLRVPNPPCPLPCDSNPHRVCTEPCPPALCPEYNPIYLAHILPRHSWVFVAWCHFGAAWHSGRTSYQTHRGLGTSEPTFGPDGSVWWY